MSLEQPVTSSGQDPPVARPAVYVIEDDEHARHAVVAMLHDRGLRSREFPSAEAFLAAEDIGRPGCLVLDYKLPGMSGLELQERLVKRGRSMPAVVTTGHADVPAAVGFMQRGAVAVLEKPFSSEQLAKAIGRATRQDEIGVRVRDRYSRISASVDRLSPREKTVLQAIVAGQLNKAIARALDVSVRTIEGDRAKIVEKFEAETTGEVIGKFAQYVLLAEMGYDSESTAL